MDGSKAEISVRGSSGLVLAPALYRPICFKLIGLESDASAIVAVQNGTARRLAPMRNRLNTMAFFLRGEKKLWGPDALISTQNEGCLREIISRLNMS